MSKVTIGLPVYNGAPALTEALASLLRMQDIDFRVVVSDNASTDNTGLIGKAFGQDDRVTYIRQPENIGAYANFRAVFDQADSPYFMWAAHDDLWNPRFASELVRALDADPGAGFAIPRWITVSLGLGPIGSYEPPGDMRHVTSTDPVERVMKFSAMVATTHKDNMVYGMWRTSILREVLETFPYEVIGGAMCQHVLAKHRGAWVDEVLFQKRYAGIAPGHPLEKAYRTAMGLKARLRGVGSKPDPYSRDAYLAQIVGGLRAAGFPENEVHKVEALHE